MGVLERIESITRANVGDLLTRSRNPEKLLNQLLSDMLSELENARQQTIAAAREGKRLKKLRLENEQLAEKWQKKAVLAIQYGKDDLARQAIARKRFALDLAREYGRECELHDNVLASLNSGLAALEKKIREIRRKRDELVVARRRTEIEQFLGGAALAEQNDRLARIERKIMSMDAQAEALAEMSSDDPDSRLREEELDAELAKLKEKVNRSAGDAEPE